MNNNRTAQITFDRDLDELHESGVITLEEHRKFKALDDQPLTAGMLEKADDNTGGFWLDADGEAYNIAYVEAFGNAMYPKLPTVLLAYPYGWDEDLDDPRSVYCPDGNGHLNWRPDLEMLDDYDLKQLRSEIRSCEDAQDWGHGATRSQWVTELYAIRDASNVEELAEALEAAAAARIRLAQEVATNLINMDDLYWIVTDLDDDEDFTAKLDKATTLEEMVDIVQRNEYVTERLGVSTKPDGWYVDMEIIAVYASMRSWRDEDSGDYVEATILPNGEIESWA